MPPGNTSPDDGVAEVSLKHLKGNPKTGQGQQNNSTVNDVKGGGEGATSASPDISNDFQELRMTNSMSSSATGTTNTKPLTADDSFIERSVVTLDSIKYHTIPALNVGFKDKSKNRDRLFCIGCRKFMLKPHVIVPCGHNICEICKDDALGSGREGVCPATEDGHRCDTHFSASEVRADKGLQRDMRSIEIECPNKAEGCEETVIVPSLGDHLKDCVATKPKMPSLESIQADLMLKSSGKNNLALETGGVSALQLMSLVTSVQKLTTESTKIKEDNLSLKQVNDELAASLTTMKTQMETFQQNMQKLMDENSQLKSKVQSLEQTTLGSSRGKSDGGLSVAAHGQIQGQLKKLGQQTTLHDITLNELDVRMQCVESATYDGKMIWKISQFSEHLDRAKKGQTLSLFSQPFYAGNRGYKMCGRVYLNGDGSGKGTHISFFFVLMRGTYDDLLSWPFQQKITLGCKDVNNNGANDIRESFNPSAKSQSFKKPISEMNVASGCPQFVSHVNMKNFIKNDTIYLYLEVDMLGLEHTHRS